MISQITAHLLQSNDMLNRFLLFTFLLGLFSGWAVAADWHQWRGPNRDGTWKETGIINHFDVDQLQPVWRVPIGSGYSGPTVAEGRLLLLRGQLPLPGGRRCVRGGRPP